MAGLIYIQTQYAKYSFFQKNTSLVRVYSLVNVSLKNSNAYDHFGHMLMVFLFFTSEYTVHICSLLFLFPFGIYICTC